MADTHNPNDRFAGSVSDPDWFAAQYRDVYPRLHLLAAGMVGDRSYAHDIVQESAIVAWKNFHKFKTGTNFAAWLSEIVRRTSYNYSRKTRGRKTAATDPDLLTQTVGERSEPGKWPVDPDTGELCEDQAEFDDLVLRALASISGEARSCLLLKVVQDLSYAEISELMQIPAGTAMSHVYRSRQQLRQYLAAPAADTKKTND